MIEIIQEYWKNYLFTDGYRITGLAITMWLLVISIGLLGIAKMQALALSSTGTAKMRSLAAIEAASLASTIRPFPLPIGVRLSQNQAPTSWCAPAIPP